MILQSVTAASADALAASQPDLGALGQTASELRGATHHRTVVGSRDVLVLSDGHLVVPAGMLAGNNDCDAARGHRPLQRRRRRIDRDRTRTTIGETLSHRFS